MLVALVSLHFAVARQLSPQEAYQSVMGVKIHRLQNLNTDSRAAADVTEPAYTVRTGDRPTVYVFNKADGGYCVVAADDAVGEILLGYTDSGSFDLDDMPQNVRLWLENYGRQVSYEAAIDETEEGDDQEAPDADHTDKRPSVTPILRTKWGQSYPFNTHAPEADGVRCPAGCVATAMAQVMFHYKWPACATGSVRYTPSADIGTISYTLDEHPFDWDAMEANIGHITDPESADAVARLIYACGVAVLMQYSPTGSSSNYVTASRVMVNNFGYDCSMRCISRECYTSDEWLDMIHAELEADRPVLYAGYDSTSCGHAFICDGYSSGGYYHINWGWKGNYNGYFRLSALDPRRADNGYNHEERMIIGIKPAEAGSEQRPVIDFSTEMRLGSTQLTRTGGGNVEISSASGIFNHSIGTVSVTFGLRLTDDDGTVIYAEAIKKTTLIPGQGIRSFSIPATRFPSDGHWTVVPAVKTESGKWFKCDIDRNTEWAYVLDASDGVLSFMPYSESLSLESMRDITVTNLTLSSDIVSGATVGIEATFCNSSMTHYSKHLTPTLIARDENVVTGTKVILELAANTENNARWTCAWDNEIDDGTYLLALIDRKGNMIGDPITVSVGAVTTAAVEEAATAGSAGICRTEVFTVAGHKFGDSSDPTNLKPGIYIFRHYFDDGTIRSAKRVIR